jgi:hypothetical protein
LSFALLARSASKCIGVVVESPQKPETMNSVFVVQHLHRLPSGEECVKFIGVYRTEQGARLAVTRVCSLPGFSKYPVVVDASNSEDDQGFYISKYELDKDHWTEGFVTMVGDQEFEE